MCSSLCENCYLTRRAFLAAGAGLALATVGCGTIGRTERIDARNEQVGTVKEGREMENLKLVTYCGLYCGLCANRGRIPQQAKALRESMVKEGYDKWGSPIPEFKDFWKLLSQLRDPDTGCPGCRQGGGPADCTIRKCAKQRNVDVCVFCKDFPCERVLGLAKGYPTLIADSKRMKEIGIEAWTKEQKERAKTGFAYVDIRCYPYSVHKE